MTTKKPAAFLALAGSLALVVTGPAAIAAPRPAESSPPPPVSSVSVGDVDVALRSKGGLGSVPEGLEGSGDRDPARVVGMIVQLGDGVDRAAVVASMDEAVSGLFPGVSVEVVREYGHALDGFALRAPAGSLEAIRGVSGVSAAFLERETYVQ